MLVRCEKCNQLYPEHHGECRHCRDGIAPSSKFKTGELPSMTLRSRTGELSAPRSGTGDLAARRGTGELSAPRSGTGDLAARRGTGELSAPRSGTGDLAARPGTGELSAPRSGTGDLAARRGTGELSAPRSGTGDLAARAGSASLPAHLDQKKENETASWQAGYGGLCPRCSYYNDGNMAFCFSCNLMLVQSNEKEVPITAYPLKDIKGLVGTFVQNLAKLNIKTTEDVLNQCASKQKRTFIATKSQMSDRTLLRLAHTADFCRVPDINPEKAAMLELIGITDMKGLLLQTPDKLAAKLQQNKALLNKQGILVLPIARHIEQWLNDARQLPPIKIEP